MADFLVNLSTRQLLIIYLIRSRRVDETGSDRETDKCEKDLDTTSKSFPSFLNVLAVSINVACNSENQCFDVAKVLQYLI